MYDINEKTRNWTIDYYCRIEGIDYEYFMYTINKQYIIENKPRLRSVFTRMLFFKKRFFGEIEI